MNQITIAKTAPFELSQRDLDKFKEACPQHFDLLKTAVQEGRFKVIA